MKFSIVTPSYRNSEWLKLCVASVADQGVEHEHLVVTEDQVDEGLFVMRAARLAEDEEVGIVLMDLEVRLFGAIGSGDGPLPR
jgi:GT2 family glycosyltransferase